MYSGRELSREGWHLSRHRERSRCEVTGRRKRGNGLEVPCRYHFVLSKAAADQEAGRFALKPSHRIVYPILTWLFTDNTELINAALD